jgi:hypothetical protein
MEGFNRVRHRPYHGVQRKTAGAVLPERDQSAINVLMWPSAAEGWPFTIFAACCFRCLDLFKKICHMRRP